jgi:hypothetical protein
MSSERSGGHYFASPYQPIPTVVDSIYSRCAGGSWGWPSGNVGSAAWPSANRVLYVPFVASGPFQIVKFFYTFGSSLGTGNIDVGIYPDDLSAPILSSGATSTAGGTVSIPFLLEATDTWFAPGRYFLAALATATSITASRITTGGAGRAKANRWFESTSSGTLPTSPTIASVSSDFFPAFGFSQHASLPI